MAEAIDSVETVEFQSGEILFLENEQTFHFYIIQSGEVEVYKSMATGKKVPLAVVSEGAALGELAMFDRRPRSATAKALGPVTAAKVSEEAYRKLLEELPEWAVAVMGSLVDRLRQTNEIVRSAGIVDARIQSKIDSIEFDNEGGTVIEDTPFLRAEAGPDDDPEMP